MMHILARQFLSLGEWLEYCGGSRDFPPSPTSVSWLGWGVWWGILLIVIWMFGGQESKFIYIDF
jgi:hypothetical protein